MLAAGVLGDVRRDVSDLLLGEPLGEDGHTAAAVGDLADDGGEVGLEAVERKLAEHEPDRSGAKGASPYMTVEEAADLLRSKRQRALAERWNETRPGPEAPVFPSSTGTPFSPSNVMGRVLKPAARRAGLGWVGFHSLRHTAASRAFRAGWKAKQVQAFLGHPTPASPCAPMFTCSRTTCPSRPSRRSLRRSNRGRQWLHEGRESVSPQNGRDYRNEAANHEDIDRRVRPFDQPPPKCCLALDF